ncbi:MAG: hypothetical protein ABI859_18240 [Pseudomonadota bacterium]
MSFAFRVPVAQRMALLFCSAMIMALCAMIVYGCVSTAQEGPGVWLLWGVLLAVALALAWMIVGETVSALRLRIAGDAVDLRLHLPPRRGHVLLPTVDESIPLASVKGIEVRHEAFRQFGIVAIQRAYRLLLSDGRSIVLGADRQMKKTVFERAAQAIALRTDLPIRERGMVEGAPGVLAAWNTSVPDWSAESLPGDLIDAMFARSARTFGILTASITIISIVRMLTRG